MMSWLQWTRKLQAIAQTGLAYSKDVYDLERFQMLRDLAVEIGAAHLERPSAEVATLIASEKGYPTPKVDVRAVVFDPQGRVLLTQERSDHRWTLPGGWADGGSTPAQMAERETLEETGYRVKATKVLAVWDRDAQGHPPMAFACYKLFFRCDLLGGSPASSHETEAVGFFEKENLPALSTGRVTAAQLARMFEHRDHPELPTDFE